MTWLSACAPDTSFAIAASAFAFSSVVRSYCSCAPRRPTPDTTMTAIDSPIARRILADMQAPAQGASGGGGSDGAFYSSTPHHTPSYCDATAATPSFWSFGTSLPAR